MSVTSEVGCTCCVECAEDELTSDGFGKEEVESGTHLLSGFVGEGDAGDG